MAEEIAGLRAEVHALTNVVTKIEKRIERMDEKMDNDYLTRREHRPIAAAVYGFFALMGATFIGVLWKLIGKTGAGP